LLLVSPRIRNANHCADEGVGTVAAVELLLGEYIKAGESYIAYLPLAHIMEFTVEMCMMFVGVSRPLHVVRSRIDD
jgi:long-chain acyl-CoA synthetase